MFACHGAIITRGTLFFSFFFLFSIPFIILALFSPSLPVLTQIRDPRTILALPPSTNSDPGSHSGPFSPLSITVHAFVLITRRIQHFFPHLFASNCTYPHAARRSQQLVEPLFCCIFANKVKSHHGGNRTQGPTLVVCEGNH